MQTTIQSNLEKAATATAATPARQIEYVDTIQAYDQWAEVSYALYTPYHYLSCSVR